MTPRPDGNKGKSKQGGRSASKPSSKQSNKKPSAEGERKKKNSETLAFDPEQAARALADQAAQQGPDLPESTTSEVPAPTQAAAQDSGQQSSPTVDETPHPGSEPAKRKVPKTLMYDTAAIAEAAAQAAAQSETKAETTSNNEVIEAQQSQLQAYLDLAQLPQAAGEAAPEAAEAEVPKRKVPKTLLFNPSAVLEAAAAAEAAKAQAEPVPPESARTESAKIDAQSTSRKVAKTLTYDTASVREAAEAAAKAQSAPQKTEHTETPALPQSEPAEPEPPKRKVPKTLMYDTAGIAAAAEAAAQAQLQEVKSTAPASAAEAPQNIDATNPAPQETAAKDSQDASTPADSSKPARKVPKTLMYDTSKILETASAIEQAAASSNAETSASLSQTEPAPAQTAAPQAESAPAAETAPAGLSNPEEFPIIDMRPPAAPVAKTKVEKPAAPAYSIRPASVSGRFAAIDEPPPELNIDSPPVRLFFEEPLTKEPQADNVVQDRSAQPLTGEPQAAETSALLGDGVDELTQQLQDTISPPAENATAAVAENNYSTPVASAAETAETAPAEAKPKRRVPRTLLYNPVLNDLGLEVDPQAQLSSIDKSAQLGSGSEAEDYAPDSSAVRRISTKKIAKTLLYHAPTNITGERSTGDTCESQSGSAASLDPAEAEKVVERYIARTMLDHQILFAELNKSQLKMEEKAAEVARERAKEPYKPFIPIECKKTALPCAWTWDATYAVEKYRYCGSCQRAVYNLAGLEMPEAEELILKAENVAKFTLYKRTDGLYMTSDCPQAVKRRSDMILMTTFSLALAAAFVVYLTTLPKPKPLPAPAPVASATKKHPPTPKEKPQPGSGHYVPGQGFVVTTPIQPQVQPPPVPNTSTTEPDEPQMWTFDKPQEGNQPIVDPRAATPAPYPAPQTQIPAQGQTVYPRQQ